LDRQGGSIFNRREQTIAEGVENPGILDMLRGFQCDEAQGYHIARPMPADEFATYLSGQ
jgi:EAL domain-containing protein (putative c-di-GMP-specific phosphodiesterase class I)